ncbi:MAG TPA: TM2 domain-containing protein, partial [Agitococcus sp.]|nr:TM2 domain-containing protein [Agitococcus sp.]
SHFFKLPLTTNNTQRSSNMGLNVSNTVVDTLPSSLKQALGQMQEQQQATFEEEYKRKMKSPLTMQLLAIFFPVQHFLMGKTGLGILFWTTFFGFGVWWIIDVISISGRVKDYNEEIARTLLRDMKIMGN